MVFNCFSYCIAAEISTGTIVWATAFLPLSYGLTLDKSSLGTLIKGLWLLSPIFYTDTHLSLRLFCSTDAWLIDLLCCDLTVDNYCCKSLIVSLCTRTSSYIYLPIFTFDYRSCSSRFISWICDDWSSAAWHFWNKWSNNTLNPF